MNAAATGGEEETVVKKANGEDGRNPGDGADPVDAPATQTLADSDGKSAGVIAPGMSSTVSVDDSASSSQATTQAARAEDTGSDEFPRKRRGILLGTRPGQATPVAVDDGKSLSWMATQAVKAANAVKASQLEQAQAWKAEAAMSEGAISGRAEDDMAAIEAGESLAMERQEPAQPSPGKAPAMKEVPPVESSQVTATTPRIPPGARAVAPRVPARMALMLGVLLMFSYAGYRHWFSGDRATGDVTATSSAIIEPDGPAAEEVKLMTPPAISVVAAPEPGSEHPTPPAAEAGMAVVPGAATEMQPASAAVPDEPGRPAAQDVKLMTPPAVSVVAAPEPGSEHLTPPAAGAGMAPQPGAATEMQPASAAVPDEPGRPAAEEVKLMTPPAVSAVAAPEPGSEHPTPPAAGAGMAVVPGAATETQPATAGAALQPAPANPASAAMPEAWYPSAVPAAPSPAVEAAVHASQPAPPSSPTPAVEAAVSASQPAPPAPAARPRHPANGYGYYRPPSSWQPYYQPGYQQQAPGRR